MRLIPIALLLLAAPLAARDKPKAADALAERLQGRTAGAPVSCISQFPTSHSQVVDGRAVIYEDGRRLYVNDFDGEGCPALRRDRVLVTRTTTGQLCSGDVVRVVDPYSRVDFGACPLGRFTPYAKTK